MTARGTRVRLPSRRRSATYSLLHRPKTEQPMKIHVGLCFYDDESLGEIWVCVSKTGSFLKATLEAWGMTASKALQCGMTVSELVKTLRKVEAWPGTVECEDVPAIHGEESRSPWDAIALLIEAEVING